MSEARPYKIVTAIDFSDMSEVVLETTLDLASRRDAPEIHAVAVLSPSRGFREPKVGDHASELEEVAKRLRALVAEKLDDFGHPLDNLGGWRVFTHARLGSPAEQIVDLAWEAEADLIVLGRHGQTRRRRLIIGSVPQRVMHLTRCPVLMAQATDYGTERDSESPPRDQCAACVEMRRTSEGSTWFCEEHSDIRITSGMFMAHHSATWTGGSGPML